MKFLARVRFFCARIIDSPRRSSRGLGPGCVNVDRGVMYAYFDIQGCRIKRVEVSVARPNLVDPVASPYVYDAVTIDEDAHPVFPGQRWVCYAGHDGDGKVGVEWYGNVPEEASRNTFEAAIRYELSMSTLAPGLLG